MFVLTPSHLFASGATQERAARETAERERLHRQNEAARQAARQRGMLELHELRRQQELQAQRQLATPVGCSPGMLANAYGRRMRQEGGRSHAGSDQLPSWAKAARLLPPLLLPARAKQQQPSVSTLPDTAIPTSGGGACPAGEGGLETALQQFPCVGSQAAEQLQEEPGELNGHEAEMGCSSRSSRSSRSSSSTSASLSEHSSSALLERLQQSLARLDGELAERSVRRQQQRDVCPPAVPMLRLEAAEAGGCPKTDQVAVTTAAPGEADVSSGTAQRLGDSKVALQAHLPAAGSPHRSAAPGPQQSSEPQQPGVQEPLHWRFKSSSQALTTAAAAALASTGSRARHLQRLPPMGAAQMQPTSTMHMTPALDGTCYIDVANVGKPCRLGSPLLAACGRAGAAQVAQLASTGPERSKQQLLPPLHRPAARRMAPQRPNLTQVPHGVAAWLPPQQAAWRNWQGEQKQWEQQQQQQQQSWQWQGQQAWQWHDWPTSWQFGQQQSVQPLGAGNPHAWLQQQM